MRFIFLTKTDWGEPPRLRHQLSRLLADAGHDVEFFERPFFPWKRLTSGETGHPRIHLHRSRQGLHHKLRLHPLLHHSNAVFEKAGIARLNKKLKLNESDVIINFNYDYYFLRDLFPRQRLITIINDNFWSRAIGGYEKPLRWALEKTCRNSDVVLTVSPPLVEQLKSFCNPELFYPWADVPYRAPENSEKRTQLLYWGYIGNRIDYNYLNKLAEFIARKPNSIEILLVGPSKNGSSTFKALKNVKTLAASSLDEIPLQKVIAALIPFKENVEDIEVISLPNKALQLLARGLPLAITGMPNFIKEPFVFPLSGDLDKDLKTIHQIKDNFSDIQPSVREFVDNNSGSQRLQQFLSYLPMLNQSSLKSEIKEFWDEQSCGEVYAIGTSEKSQYESEVKMRYQLEPYIFEFAKFSEGKGKDVLEIGVGMGSDHSEWAKSNPKSLTGVDLTPRAVAHTKKKFEIFGLNSDVKVDDAEQLSFVPDSFDLVYSWGVLHHSPNTQKAIENVYRVLRSGGMTRIMIYHTYSLTGYMLWIRYGLLAGRPLRTLKEIYFNHLESPGTKAYSKEEAREMFHQFKKVDVKVMLNLGDLLEGAVGQRHPGVLLSMAKLLWPRWLIRVIFKNHGLMLLIEAYK